jgi:hypothetical protein
MPELPDASAVPSPRMTLLERLRSTPGLVSLVAEAEATWRSRAAAAQDADPDDSTPAWRAFEDAFPTFYEFTNRPR